MAFAGQVNLQVLVPILDSVAAHLAAKLQAFDTDERTLTDELCDMTCVWLNMSHGHGLHVGASPRARSLPATQFRLNLTKTTAHEEARTGADLEFVIETPLGRKRALCQAKVLDPSTLKLRCDSKKGWDKLRKQLKDMGPQGPMQPYLLLYVPAGELDGACHGYPTWEQGYATIGACSRSSRFGATAIERNALLKNNRRWATRKKVDYARGGSFNPTGMSLTRMVLELLVCLKGQWTTDSTEDELPRLSPFRRLTVGVDEIGRNQWEEVASTTRARLEETSDDVGFGAA